MAGLIEATDLTPQGDGFSAQLDPAWEIWGPAGGYLAAITLRAVRERAAAEHRPVTLTGQFVRVARPGAVDVAVQPVKQGASALYTVTLSQSGEPVFQAQIWTTVRRDPAIPVAPTAPDVPAHDDLPDHRDLLAERGLPLHSFWDNLESRPVNFRAFSDPPAQSSHQYRWMRFVDWDAPPDPYYDAMRSALLIDLAIWPGHWHRITERAGYLAPSLDLTVYFHSDEEAGEWLLSDADSDVAGEGLLSGRVRMWSVDGRALATGSGHCLIVVPKEQR